MAASVVEAGKKGGLSLLRKRGRGYFCEIGREGQRVTRAKYPNMASTWGKLGGRPRKLPLSAMGDTQAKNNEKEDANPPLPRLCSPSKYNNKFYSREGGIRTEAVRRKPGRPRAIPAGRVQEVISLYRGGLGYRAIARELEKQGLMVDWSTVRNVIKSWRNGRNR